MRLGALLSVVLLIACGGDAKSGDAGAGGAGAASGGSSGASASGGTGGSGGRASGGSGGGMQVGGTSGSSSGGAGGSSSGGTGGRGEDAGESGGSGGSDAGVSHGDAGTVQCPEGPEPPLYGGDCEGEGQCTHSADGTPGCTSLWECFESKWVSIARVECDDSADLCPATPEEIEGEACIGRGCVYAPNVVCRCDPPCGGAVPDPDTLVMGCFEATRAVCNDFKLNGDPCAPIGDVCAPDCCGTKWTCTADGWQSEEVPCPP